VPGSGSPDFSTEPNPGSAAHHGVRGTRRSPNFKPWRSSLRRVPFDPQNGRNAFGYKLARQFGLKIVETKPALVPFVLRKDHSRYCDLAASRGSRRQANHQAFAKNADHPIEA